METTERELAEEREDASEWLLADEAGGSGEPELRSGESELAELAQPEADDLAWYCVQTRPKSEHIARASLLQFGDVEVYCPRLRYHKTTRRGKVWFTEALFPCYLFARFDLGESFFQNKSVGALVVEKLPVSISLGLWTFFIS